MSGGGVEEGNRLEFTPTWVVAVVCSVIVALSHVAERLLHYAGKFLKKKNQKPLYEALQKIKEELMLLGFISLLLTVTQNGITKICVPKGWTHHMLPCSFEEKELGGKETPVSHFQTFSPFPAITPGTIRRLLAEAQPASEALGYCAKKDKVPLLSIEALHDLHIFIFVLAIVHVTFCVLTVVFGGLRIRQWKHWEDSIAKENHETEAQRFLQPTVTHVRSHDFIRDHFTGFGKDATAVGWVKSFFKQFYGSVTKFDYVTLRLGFIMSHCRGNPKFDFHKYMIRALEDDFKKVVGIRWYLWIFVVIFLLLNVHGWKAYFWIAFIPLILLLAVGTKLEHVITQLAHKVAEKHIAIERELVVQPSDDHFWFHQPRIVLLLIHFILFQNAFEIAFFFWIWVMYGFKSCIMGKVHFIVPRLIVGAFIQLLCSYSTLPLYAIVIQMGTHFKKAIFDEQLQQRLVEWAQEARKRGPRGESQAGHESSRNDSVAAGVQLGSSIFRRASSPEENANAIVPRE